MHAVEQQAAPARARRACGLGRAKADARCRPSLNGSPTPPKVGVEKVPNFLSVHLISGGAMLLLGPRLTLSGTAAVAAPAASEARAAKGTERWNCALRSSR